MAAVTSEGRCTASLITTPMFQPGQRTLFQHSLHQIEKVIVKDIEGLLAMVGGDARSGPSSPRPSSNSSQFPSTRWRLPWMSAGSDVGANLSR